MRFGRGHGSFIGRTVACPLPRSGDAIPKVAKSLGYARLGAGGGGGVGAELVHHDPSVRGRPAQREAHGADPHDSVPLRLLAPAREAVMPHAATHLAGAPLAQLHLVDALLTLRAADTKLALPQEGGMQPDERARRRLPERHEDAFALTVAQREDRGVGVRAPTSLVANASSPSIAASRRTPSGRTCSPARITSLQSVTSEVRPRSHAVARARRRRLVSASRLRGRPVAHVPRMRDDVVKGGATAMASSPRSWLG